MKAAARCIQAISLGIQASSLAVLAASGSPVLAQTGDRILDPPLTERTLGALQRACRPDGIEHLVHPLVLRYGDRPFGIVIRPRRWDERTLDPTEIGGFGSLFHCRTRGRQSHQDI